MIYLSKGIVQKGSTEQLLFVLYGGQKFELTGNAAAALGNELPPYMNELS